MQLAVPKPTSQMQEPSVCAIPLPEQVVASEDWHKSPTQGAAQSVHVPLLCAVPRPEHVVASEYLQAVISYLREVRGWVRVIDHLQRPATADCALLLLRAQRDVHGVI